MSLGFLKKFQLCDIENLVSISKTIAKLIAFTLRNIKGTYNSQNFGERTRKSLKIKTLTTFTGC